MATINVSQVIGKMKIGNADKVILTSLISGLVGDVEKLRAANSSLLAKLDSNHGAAADHSATLNVPVTGLTVGK